VLGAGTVSFTSAWWNTKQPNWRIPIATFAVALVFAGIEKLNERAAVGLGVMMLITVLVTPINGKSPVQTLSEVAKG
jgi:multisubunit Na+/H+ antiporter MnhG subunit